MKTDVKSYYESIDNTILLEPFDKDISDPFIWRLLVQFVKRSVEFGGNFTDVKKGIARGCALSPVIAAYYLKALDEHMASNDRCFYIRYMDDILVLAKTRWQLRMAVKVVNQAFNRLKVEQAPDKTFIGKIDKGFDFLGYRFSLQGLSLASVTINKMQVKYQQLYEQTKAAPERAAIRAEYLTCWLRWTQAGLVGELLYLTTCFTGNAQSG